MKPIVGISTASILALGSTAFTLSAGLEASDKDTSKPAKPANSMGGGSVAEGGSFGNPGSAANGNQMAPQESTMSNGSSDSSGSGMTSGTGDPSDPESEASR
ncbi:MAG: hypothetical protein WDO24_29810 [Pseudomonadota bacterium]